MKRLFTLLTLFFIVHKIDAQINCMSSSTPSLIDSSNFEAGNTNLNFVLQTDTTNPNNIWQIGSVTKLGFDSAYSGAKALQTDTLNPYPVNDSSAFYVWVNSSVSSSFNTFSMTWYQKYDVDSLIDSCIIQCTIDSGATWQNLNSSSWPSINFNGKCLYTTNGGVFFTGQSNGWEKATVCVTFFTIKKLANPKTAN